MGSIEILSTAVEVIHEPVLPPDDTSVEILRKFMRPLLIISPMSTPGSLKITSNRDQTEVLVSGDQTGVRDFSGDVLRASDKLPELLESVLGLLSATEIQSYEIQFLLEYRMDGAEDAGRWLAPKVLKDDFIRNLGTDVASGLVAFGFSRGTKFQTLDLRVLDASTVMVKSVASESVEALAVRESLGSELTAQYRDLTDMLRKLGLD